jgi:DNA polymerase-3 subunit beta
MKFTAERATLLSAILGAREVAANNSPLVQLNMMRLTLSGDMLVVESTDMDACFHTTATVDGIQGDDILIPAARLVEIVKALPDGCQVEISTDDKAPDGIVIKSGRSRFRLPSLSPELFPQFSPVGEGSEFTLSEAEWRRMLTLPAPFMSNEQVRHYLCGVNLCVTGGKLRSAATSGHFLAAVTMDCPIGASGLTDGIIIPATAIGRLSKLASGDILVKCDGQKASFTWGASTFTTKLVDGTYPDIDRIIPEYSPVNVTVNAREMRAACSRVAIVGHDTGSKARTIKMDVRLDDMTVSGGGDGEDGEEVIAAASSGVASIKLDPTYLNTSIQACGGDEILIGISDIECVPCVIRPADDTCVTIIVMGKR